jgi:hypothetical protein
MKALVTAAAATAALALSAVAFFPTDRAQARIVCDGPFQIVQGSALATPYCEDNYVASVARGYGMRVTDAAVRQNPTVKAEVCRWFGHDARIRQFCSSYPPTFRPPL